jgi:hypothetical protein
MKESRASLQRGGNEEFLHLSIVLNPQHIRLAADLAVFHIALPAACGFIHRGGIPLAATRTLKTSFHEPLCRSFLPGGTPSPAEISTAL